MNSWVYFCIFRTCWPGEPDCIVIYLHGMGSHSNRPSQKYLSSQLNSNNYAHISIGKLYWCTHLHSNSCCNYSHSLSLNCSLILPFLLLFPSLQFTFTIIDFDGHGYSDGLKGYVHSLEYLLDDVTCLLKALYSDVNPTKSNKNTKNSKMFHLVRFGKNVPFFFMAHSM